MYKTIRSLTVLAFIASAVACGGESDVGGDESNVGKGEEITARSSQKKPATLVEMIATLQSSSTGRMLGNPGDGAWNYSPSSEDAPFASARVVSFTKDKTDSSHWMLDLNLSQTESCGADCKPHVYLATETRSIPSELGLSIDGESYVLTAEIPGAAGVGSVGSYGLKFSKRVDGKLVPAFSLMRKYKG